MSKDLLYKEIKKSLKSYFLNLKSSFGFTLIELLIVIAIIGVLATILLVNFMGVRQRTRDAQRKADLRQIQSAIELYKADQSTYPASPLYQVNCSTSSPLTYPQTGTPIVIYMTKLPCDPSGASWWNSGNYYYSLNGTTYTLGACIENANDADSQVTSTNPSGSSPTGCASSKYYVLTNP